MENKKIDTLLPKPEKGRERKKGRITLHKFGKEKGEMTTRIEGTEINISVKELYHKQLYSNKLRNIEETTISWQNTNSPNPSKNGKFK